MSQVIKYKRRIVELSRGKYRTLGVSIPAGAVKRAGLKKRDLVEVHIYVPR